ncbi:unnamed protein product [Aphanomyces euteiches]
MASAPPPSPIKSTLDSSPWVQVHGGALKEIVTADMLPVRPNPLARDLQDSFSKTGLQDVLKFDINGNATMLRMRRADVLKMTQQAAAQLHSPGAGAVVEVSSSSVLPPIPPSKPVIPTLARLVSPPHSSVSDAQPVHMRDLRKLDYAFVESYEPSIVVRKQAILVNADPIRSVIMRDCCLMFVPDKTHPLVGLLKDKFKEPQGDDDVEMAFEFRALEAILSTVCKFLADDFERMAPIVNSSLERLASAQMSSGELETLRTLKNAMNEFESQVNGLRRVLMEILDNEVDLHLLYLTQLHSNPVMLNELWSFDAEEAESLLEVYLQDIHNTKTKVALMVHRIHNTESVVMLKMDAVRNYLLTADMIFTLIMVCLTFGMFVTAAFGMNLTSGLEQTPGAFMAVIFITVIFSLVTVYVGVAFFRKRGVLI